MWGLLSERLRVIKILLLLQQVLSRLLRRFKCTVQFGRGEFKNWLIGCFCNFKRTVIHSHLFLTVRFFISRLCTLWYHQRESRVTTCWLSFGRTDECICSCPLPEGCFRSFYFSILLCFAFTPFLSHVIFLFNFNHLHEEELRPRLLPLARKLHHCLVFSTLWTVSAEVWD